MIEPTEPAATPVPPLPPVPPPPMGSVPPAPADAPGSPDAAGASLPPPPAYRPLPPLSPAAAPPVPERRPGGPSATGVAPAGPLLPPALPPPPTTAPGPGGPSAGRVLVLLVGAVFTACFLGGGAFATAARLGQEERTEVVAPVPGVRHLVIEVESGSITVRGTDADEVRGSRRLSRDLLQPEVTELAEGDMLRLRARCPGPFGSCAVSYDLDVPRDVSLTLSTHTGTVRVEGVDGDVTARSTAGSVDGHDLGGTLEMTTAAGRVEGTALRSERVVAGAAAGGVDLVFVVAPTSVSARSAAGPVDVTVPDDGAAYRVDAHGSGRDGVRVPQDPRSARTIAVSSAAGPVSVVPAG